MKLLKCIGIVFAVFLLFQSCAKDDQDEIEIGVVLSMTGELGSFGEAIWEGMELAQEEINESNLLEGKKIRLLLNDSRTQPSSAVSALQRLINVEGVNLVLGDVSSSTTHAMVPVAEDNGVFLLSTGASSPELSNISPLFARNYPSSDAESRAAAEFIFNELGEEQTTIVYVNSEYGLGLRNEFVRVFEELGGEIISEEAYETGRSDFRSLVQRIRQTNPKALYLAGNQVEMGNFIRQYREARVSAQVVSNVSFLEDDCLDIAGSAADGVIVPIVEYNPDDPSQTGAQEFRELVQEKLDREATFVMAVGYDGVMLMARAINEVGRDPRDIADYIRSLDEYDGALGRMSFENGDVSLPIEFKTVKNGSVVTYN